VQLEIHEMHHSNQSFMCLTYRVDVTHSTGVVYLVCEFFPLGGLDVQLEIWEERLSAAVRLCLGQQICEVRTREPFTSTKEPYISTKEPCICMSVKQRLCAAVRACRGQQICKVWGGYN